MLKHTNTREETYMADIMEEDAPPGEGIAPEDIGYDPRIGSRVAAPPTPDAAPDIQALPTPYQGEHALLPSEGAPLPEKWWLPSPPQGARSQPFSATPFIRDVFEKGIGGTKEAQAAITQALQLEGILGFDADRKAGVPVAEAMAKWAPKMYAQHPNVAASFARKPPAPFVPTEATVGGQKLIQVSPNRFAFPQKAPAEGLKASDVLHATTSELNALQKAIAIEDDPAQEKVLRQQYRDALGRLQGMNQSRQGGAGGGIRVRDKKTGKTFRYMGDPSHVPTDQYDLLK